MRNISMRYLKKAGPTKSGREFKANSVEAKALEAVGHAERIFPHQTQYLTRDLVSHETKENALQGSVDSVDETVLISEKVKVFAVEHGIDLAAVKGSGQNGRILKNDIESLVAQKEKES